MSMADLDRLVDPAYLQGVESIAISDLREKRAECQNVESRLSYLRRLIQGRLDIVGAEIERRAGGHPVSDPETLVADLSRILGDKVRAPGPGRLPTNLLPPDDDQLTAELDIAAGPDQMGSLPSLAADEVTALSDRLKEQEAQVSARRRAIFDVIDSLESELGRRYREGEADPTSLLG